MERYKITAMVLIFVMLIGITAMAGEMDSKTDGTVTDEIVELPSDENEAETSEPSPTFEPSIQPTTDPSVVPSEEPSIDPSLDPDKDEITADPSQSPESISSPNPSDSGEEEPTPTPSMRPARPTEEPRVIEMFNINNIFPDKKWIPFGFKGSEYKDNLDSYLSNTAMSQTTGATIEYHPGIVTSGKVNVYIDIVKSSLFNMDRNVKCEIYHNGTVEVVYIDMSIEKPGYKYLGTYDFGGIYSGNDEFVRITRISNDNTVTIASSVRFNILSDSKKYDEDTPPKQFYYSVLYGNTHYLG